MEISSEQKTVKERLFWNMTMKTDSLNSLNQTAHGHNLHMIHLEGDILKKHQMDRKKYISMMDCISLRFMMETRWLSSQVLSIVM